MCLRVHAAFLSCAEQLECFLRILGSYHCFDFLYVAKRVPYPLTVEVYGGGGYGKLQPGALQVSQLLSLLQCDCYFVLV
jgi:hypothetical protein